MNARPLKRRSLAEQLREQMEQFIRSGEWQMGQRIPAEAQLARQFEVSHSTVREAVQGLIHAGMLRARPGDGTYVLATNRLDAAFDHRLEELELASIIEARLALEKAIVELLCTTRTDAHLAELREALKATKQPDGKGIEADMAFHCLIAEATANPLLSQLYQVMAGYLSRHFSEVLHERQYEAEALDLHDDLLQAIEQRDVMAARAAVTGISEFTRHCLKPS